MSQFRQVAAVCWFFVLIGLTSLTVCIITFVHTREFLASAKIAHGHVVRLDPNTSSHVPTTYYTVFTFLDDSEHPHTVRTSYAQSPPPYQAGDQILVLYPPDAPDDARIRSFSSLWLFPMILGAIGVVFPAAGLFAFISARKTYGAS